MDDDEIFVGFDMRVITKSMFSVAHACASKVYMVIADGFIPPMTLLDLWGDNVMFREVELITHLPISATYATDRKKKEKKTQELASHLKPN